MDTETPSPVRLDETAAPAPLSAHLKRLLKLVKLLARDPRVPRPVRALILVGLLPVPGPFDEIVLVGAVTLLLVIRPGLIRALWRESAA
jgi:hypothetical protein